MKRSAPPEPALVARWLMYGKHAREHDRSRTVLKQLWFLRGAIAVSGFGLLVAGAYVALRDEEATVLLVAGTVLVVVAVLGARITEFTATRGETTATVRLSPDAAAEAAIAAADETIRGVERAQSSADAVEAIEAARSALDELRRTLPGSLDLRADDVVWVNNDPRITVGHWHTQAGTSRLPTTWSTKHGGRSARSESTYVGPMAGSTATSSTPTWRRPMSRTQRRSRLQSPPRSCTRSTKRSRGRLMQGRT